MGIINPREPNDSQPTNENKENDAEVGQLGQLFMLAGREEFARANLLFSASKPLLYSLDIIN
ncbi:MAG: hypothetical protein SPE53_00005 [Prevotella sp.]|nr:hypothetical protein [Prevotella sp.]